MGEANCHIVGRQQAQHRSYLKVRSQAEHMYWTARAIVGGVKDELIIGGKGEHEIVEVILRLQDALGADAVRVMPQAISYDETITAGFEVVGVIF